MKPEDMNTINDDGKAFSGNYTPVKIAAALIIAFSTIAIVQTISAIL